MTIYPLQTTREDNGSFLITCPTLPELTTFAETAADVERIAALAIAEAIAARLQAGERVPCPQPASILTKTT